MQEVFLLLFVPNRYICHLTPCPSFWPVSHAAFTHLFCCLRQFVIQCMLHSNKILIIRWRIPCCLFLSHLYILLSSLVNFFSPINFHLVLLYFNSAGPNVRHGFLSFQNLWYNSWWGHLIIKLHFYSLLSGPVCLLRLLCNLIILNESVAMSSLTAI